MTIWERMRAADIQSFSIVNAAMNGEVHNEYSYKEAACYQSSRQGQPLDLGSSIRPIRCWQHACNDLVRQGAGRALW